MNAETWQRVNLLVSEWKQVSVDTEGDACLRGPCERTVVCLRPRGHAFKCWPTEVEP